MISEPFAVGNSLVHRLDPRIRVLATTLYACVVALAEDFSVLTVALIISMLLLIFSRTNLGAVAKRLIIVNMFIVLLWLMLPLTFGGHTQVYLGPLSLSQSGVLLCAQITLKSNAIVIAFIALIATMPLSNLGYALDWLRVPKKIVHLLLMTYRYVFVIEQEYQRLLRAARTRGFISRTNLHTYRTYAYLIGMLFVRAAARAERVHQAMVCRGFKGTFYCLQTFKTGRESWIFALAMAISVAGLIWMEWVHS